MPHVLKDSRLKTIKSTELLGFASQSLLIIIGLAIVLVAAVGIAFYFYLQYQQTQNQLNKTTQGNVQAALIADVGKLIVLPTGEQPTIATVSDLNRLKGQSFFAHARNGDKVLIYTKAQEAILYDPMSNKIVEVGPISLTQITPTSSLVQTQDKKGATPTLVPVKVAIYNGTPTAGLANKIGIEIQQKMPSVTIVEKADAKEDYTSTLVVDLTGKNAESASTIAEILGAKIAGLPKGEIKPQTADLLVILGK